VIQCRTGGARIIIGYDDVQDNDYHDKESDYVYFNDQRDIRFIERLNAIALSLDDDGSVWIHGQLVLASWSSSSHKVSKHEG
jgi:hypothetical protein